MSDDEVSEFIISRLAELVVALFNEHVGEDAEASAARIDTRIAMAALGRWAARNGRPELMPILDGLARKISDPPRQQEPEPPLYQIPRITSRIKYGW